jgi:signal transduction histidine kinase
MTRSPVLSSPDLPPADVQSVPPSGVPTRWWLPICLILFIFTLVGLLEAGQSLMMQYLSNRSPSGWRVLLLGVVDWYIWAALTPFVLWGSQRFPIGQKNWPRRLLLHSLLGVICATTVIAFMIPILERIHQRSMDWMLVPVPSGSVELAAHLLGFRFVIYLIVYWTIVGVSHAIAYYRKYREGQMHAILLESRLAQTQLQMLKMQLQPHFLFNTLNAISSLMHQDVELADQMLARLGQLLRTTLESAGTQEVSFKQELEFVELYLEIEQARFGPRLEVHIDAEPETMDACVPNLILQPLVENAIRHGISPRAGAGHIEIRAQRFNGSLQVQVLDDGPGLRPDQLESSREGVGLSNTRERLKQLYGDAHQFTLANRDEGGVVVTLRVPFREEAGEQAPILRGNGEAALRPAGPSFRGVSGPPVRYNDLRR